MEASGQKEVGYGDSFGSICRKAICSLCQQVSVVIVCNPKKEEKGAVRVTIESQSCCTLFIRPLGMSYVLSQLQYVSERVTLKFMKLIYTIL